MKHIEGKILSAILAVAGLCPAPQFHQHHVDKNIFSLLFFSCTDEKSWVQQLHLKQFFTKLL